jgi:RNA polymerase sigma-70 factor (ECF subfamily)
MESTDENLTLLLPLVSRGEPGAAERLVEALYPVVIRIVRNHLPRGLDEQDLAQEVFLKVFAKLESFRAERPLEHWVARITRNVCFDHLRKQRRRKELRCADLSEEEERVLEAVLAEDPASGSHLDSTEATGELIAKLLGMLRPAEERILRLLDLEGMPVKEIAALLGWGESRIKVTAFRARRKLQDVMRGLEPGLRGKANQLEMEGTRHERKE